VHAAETAKVPDRRGATARPHGPVVELDPRRGPADPARGELPLAAATVPLPDRPAHVGRHAARLRGPRFGQGLLHDSLRLRVALEQEVEPGLEDLARARARMGMRERRPGGLELLEEAARDGDV